ncbi:MAG: IPTL-CTERM sorting domain-containing protein [Lysobacterales bacterium]
MKNFAIFVIGSLLMTVGVAQASPLYITQYNGTSGAIVETDTGAIIDTFTTTVSSETGIAVNGTVRIIPAFAQTSGSEYDLSGNVINNGIYDNPEYNSLYDGTTDGQYNYSIDHNGSYRVLRFDLNWQNGATLFTPALRSSGITYDALSNTLWITTSPNDGAPNGNIQQFSMTGELISEFSTAAIGGNHYGLAFDSTDGTLWTSDYQGSTLSQFDTSGNLLKEIDMSALGFTDFFGLEFNLGGAFEGTLAPVPVLSNWMLLLLVLIIGFAGLKAGRKRLAA